MVDVETRLRSPNIDAVHSQAIWEEIGERLRYCSARDEPAMPARLLRLLSRLVELDGRQRA